MIFNSDNNSTFFAFVAFLQKDGFLKLFSIFKSNLPPGDDIIAKSDAINLNVDF